MPRHNRGSPQTFGFRNILCSSHPQRPGSAATPRSFASRNDGAAGGSESSVTESLAA